MRVKIEVRKADIEAGVKGNCQMCPIARAAIRAGFPAVGVGGELTVAKSVAAVKRSINGETTYKDIVETASLPEKAHTFIEKFDDGYKVKPFSFFVNFPKEVLAKVGFRHAA
jgi:hypothetical protein